MGGKSWGWPTKEEQRGQIKRMNGGWGLITNGDRVSFWDDKNVLKLDSGAGCTTNILKSIGTL